MSRFSDAVRELALEGLGPKQIRERLDADRKMVSQALRRLRECGDLPGAAPAPVPGFALRQSLLIGGSYQDRIERIIRQAFALAQSQQKPAAVRLLQRAAERIGEPAHTNFLALADLVDGSPDDRPLGYRNLGWDERVNVALAYGHLPG